MATKDQLIAAFTEAQSLFRKSRLLIVGSQSILGSVPEENLPARVTMSAEFDMALMDDTEAALWADVIDGHLGELSPFHQDHGWYVQGVSPGTAKLPAGWQDRIIEIEIPDAPAGNHAYTLEIHDLCASKMCRNEQKDREYVEALVVSGLADPNLLRARLDLVPLDEEFTAERRRVAVKWAKGVKASRSRSATAGQHSDSPPAAQSSRPLS
jgi:hypothetical protein